MAHFDEDYREYASSPCMMQEFEGGGAIAHILYLRLEEGPDGFRWQVCVHEWPDPVEISRDVYRLESEALNMGRIALDKVCDHFRHYQVLR